MKLVRHSEDARVFALSTREKQLLLEMLDNYPVTPARIQPQAEASGATADADSQELLDQALEEQRSQNRNQAQALVGSKRRFRRTKSGWHISLKNAETEWLLQVLNDIRVGNWIRLGSPEELSKPLELFQVDPEAFVYMEVAGVFQMQILHALECGGADSP